MSTRRISSYRIIAGVAATLASGGCTLDAQDGALQKAAVASTKSPIIGGDASIGDWNLIEISGCSAVALDEEWVLTARHCTPGLVVGVDRAVRVSPVETRSIREIHQHASEDIALLRVVPFTRIPFHIEPWNAPTSWLVGKDLHCIGRGANATPASGFGTWRSATMSIGTAFTDGYRLLPNSKAQIQWLGDSGGPCLYHAATGTYVTGIQSTATYTCAPGTVSCVKETAQTITSAYQVALSPAISGWVKDIQKRSPMFFYESSTGVGWVSLLERNGTYRAVGKIDGFSTDWTHVVGVHNDTLLFYNAGSGAAATATLDKNGNYSGGGAVTGTVAGWTHVTAVGPDGVFFSNASTRAAATARVDATGAFSTGEAVSLGLVPMVGVGVVSDFFTHVTGTKNGVLFFYSAPDGAASTATVDSELHYKFVEGISGFDTTWTRVTGVGDNGLFFYDALAGNGYMSQLDDGGHYHSFGSVTGFSTGFGHVVGASNGGLFFLDVVSGKGAVSRIDWGKYTFVGSLSDFASWSHVTAS